MEKRKLGNGNLEVSAIGLGCMGMTFSYLPPPDRNEMIALLRSAVDLGVTFFDTAVIATKFGFKPGNEAQGARYPDQLEHLTGR